MTSLSLLSIQKRKVWPSPNRTNSNPKSSKGMKALPLNHNQSNANIITIKGASIKGWIWNEQVSWLVSSRRVVNYLRPQNRGFCDTKTTTNMPDESICPIMSRFSCICLVSYCLDWDSSPYSRCFSYSLCCSSVTVVSIFFFVLKHSLWHISR